MNIDWIGEFFRPDNLLEYCGGRLLHRLLPLLRHLPGRLVRHQSKTALQKEMEHWQISVDFEFVKKTEESKVHGRAHAFGWNASTSANVCTKLADSGL